MKGVRPAILQFSRIQKVRDDAEVALKKKAIRSNAVK